MNDRSSPIEKGFIMVDDRKSFADAAKTKMGQMTGTPSSRFTSQEVLELYKNMVNKVPFTQYSPAHKKIIGNSPIQPDSLRMYTERVQEFIQQAESTLCLEPKYNSYGISAPAYLKLTNINQNEGESLRLKPDFRSLLIGAYSIDTVQEYQATMNFFNPQAKAYVIDIEGYETPKAGNFVYADGTRAPFSDNSFDTIHTNVLLYMLNRSNGQEGDNTDRSKLFREMFRLLKPNGTLVMIEGSFDQIHKGKPINECLDLLIEELHAVGFNQVEIIPTLEFKNRDGLSKFMRSSHGNLDLDLVQVSNKVLAIRAVKKI